MSDSFSFPKSLLNQIEECSNGGFVLVFLDGDEGLDVALSYTSETNLRALISKAQSWSQGMTEILDDSDKERLEDFYSDE